jgi:hypothetical protein
MRRMGLLVVLLFTVPVLVGLAVVAVKTIEFTVSRDIASTKVVARRTMLPVLGATAIGLVAWFVYVAMGMPSMRPYAQASRNAGVRLGFGRSSGESVHSSKRR